MKILTVSAAFGVDASWMLESAHRHGIDVQLVQGEFHDLYDAKITQTFRYIRSRLDGFTHVMLVDSTDVLFVRGLDEIGERFERLGAPFVMAAEANCWPERNRDRHPAGGRFRFMNTGWYMATAEEWLWQAAAVERADRYSCDQITWQTAWLDGRVQLKLDTEGSICRCLFLTEWEELDQWQPCIWHANGKWAHLERLKRKLEGSPDPITVPRVVQLRQARQAALRKRPR